MQQILQQLQQGEHEVVQDRQDGTLEMRVKPPTALNLRAARLIVQIINERDQVVNSNVQLNAQLHQYLVENEALKQQIKELNDRLNSSPVPQANTSTPAGSNSGIHPDGETETPRSEAS